MKRFFFVAIAAFALLAPSVSFAEGTAVYIPGAHPRVVVVQPETAPPALKAQQGPLTPAQVIARHDPMANGYRTANRVNQSAAAHCDRMVAQARAELNKSF